MKCLKKIFSVFFCAVMFLISNNLVHAEDFVLCEGFTSEELSDELRKFISDNSFKMHSDDGKENDWVRLEDLRYLKLRYFGFDDEIHDGEMVVHESVAREVLEIFKELLDTKFPIYQMRLIDNYNSDDEASMSDNNTSCLRTTEESFSFRSPWHAMGLAIDINPMNNPCSYPQAKDDEPKFVPHNASRYLDRTLSEKGMIKEGDACYNAFTRRGWEWGGSWTDPVDLHHFQKYVWTTKFPRKYKK